MSLLVDNVTEAESRSVSCSQARCSDSAYSDDSPRSESCALVHVGSGGAKRTGKDVNQQYGSHSPFNKAPYAVSNSTDEVRYSDLYSILEII